MKSWLPPSWIEQKLPKKLFFQESGCPEVFYKMLKGYRVGQVLGGGFSCCCCSNHWRIVGSSLEPILPLLCLPPDFFICSYLILKHRIHYRKFYFTEILYVTFILRSKRFCGFHLKVCSCQENLPPSWTFIPQTTWAGCRLPKGIVIYLPRSTNCSCLEYFLSISANFLIS